jgi:branched-chain amino acid transport system substrate-binding protein
VATKFASDRSIVAVIGHFNSSCSLAGKPIYKREGVVELSPGSTNVNVCIGSEWTFRNVYRDDFQGQFLARYVKQKLQLNRVAVFYDNDDYGIGLKNAFLEEAQKQGIEIVTTAAYTRETVDFKPELANIKALNPDAMFVSGLYNEAALITLQARQQGMTMQILGADGVFSPGYVQVAGKAAEGTLITTPFLFDAGGKDAQEVLKKFKEKYKEDPDCWAALTYDALGIIADAIQKAGPDRKAIRDHLASMNAPDKAYPGITGRTYFDANGDCVKPAYVSAVKDGRFVSAPVQMLE